MTRSCLTSAMLLLALGAALWAQRPRPGVGVRPPGMTRPGMKKGGVPDRSPLDRWFRMSPRQRENALQKLPPERQQKIRDQLAKFTNMPEKERARLTQRYERFAELTPEKQELVRRQLRRFGKVPVERRQVLAREFRRLRGLPETDRRERIESYEFRRRYSFEEQQMLEGLAGNLSPAQN